MATCARCNKSTMAGLQRLDEDYPSTYAGKRVCFSCVEQIEQADSAPVETGEQVSLLDVNDGGRR